jgi:DNA-binding response OmpR family regulator
MNARVLVVDDDRDAADTLALLINALGCQARAVYDGRQALEQIDDFQPGMVLIDLGMPGWNGYETEIRIREQCGSNYVIVVALTGWTRDEDKLRAWDCGFDLYVTKPIDNATLKELLALLDPSAPVNACESLDESDLREFKALLYQTSSEAAAAKGSS